MREKNQPLRILQVVTKMDRGGLETMLMNYYRYINRSRVQFDFLTHRSEKADYDDEIESLGGKIYHLPRLIPWSSSYKAALNSFFIGHPEYQIIHVHQDCLSGVILKEAQKDGIQIRIAHSHNANQDKNFKYPIKLFYKHNIIHYATDLMACGRKAGQWMFQNDKFTVLHNAINVSDYIFDEQKRSRVRNNLNISENSYVIGHIGRFVPQKNHDCLVNVFASLIMLEPNARLLLVGDGELRSKIEEKVKCKELSERVIFTGVRSDIPDLLQAMDVFVLPSLYEGLPVTLIEAQSAGLPCVISDKVSTECELVKGLITKVSLSDTPEQWAQHILSLRWITRTNRYEEVKASGYDIIDEAKKLEEYYLEKAENV